MSSTTAAPLKLAICFANHGALGDINGPIEQIGVLFEGIDLFDKLPPRQRIKPTLIAETLEPLVTAVVLPRVVADTTYEAAMNEQFDIILIGGLDKPDREYPKSLFPFLAKQVPGAKYVLSVCVGAIALGMAGVLDGRKATVTKAGLPMAAVLCPKVEWVRKARWVVDGKFWTAAGPAAGVDMSSAFLEHIESKEMSEAMRLVFEFGKRQADDDEFGEIWAGPGAPDLWDFSKLPLLQGAKAA